NCNGWQIIPGANSISFAPTVSGWYSLILTQGGCTDTTPCFSVTASDIYEYNEISNISIQPNPSSGKFTLSGNNVAGIEVLNMIGEKVSFESEINYQNYEVKLQSPPGIYVVAVTLNSGLRVIKRVILK